MSTKKGTRKSKTKSTTVTAASHSSDEDVTGQSVSQKEGGETQTAVQDWTQESKLVSVDDTNSTVSTTTSNSTSNPNTTSSTSSSTTSSTTVRKSVLDFDRTTVKNTESEKVSSLSIDELLMVLITRGETQKNPVISGGCEKLLRQINRESFTLPPSGRPNRSGLSSNPSQGSDSGPYYKGRPQNNNNNQDSNSYQGQNRGGYRSNNGGGQGSNGSGQGGGGGGGGNGRGRSQFPPNYQLDDEEEEPQQVQSFSPSSQQFRGRPFRGPSGPNQGSNRSDVGRGDRGDRGDREVGPRGQPRGPKYSARSGPQASSNSSN
jgi:hypothetical protein